MAADILEELRHMKLMRSMMIVALLALTACGSGTSKQDIGKIIQDKQQAEADRDRWRTRAVVAISVAVVLLFVGAGLGAGAKRDAKKQGQ